MLVSEIEIDVIVVLGGADVDSASGPSNWARASRRSRADRIACALARVPVSL
jgi:hypothetical protein